MPSASRIWIHGNPPASSSEKPGPNQPANAERGEEEDTRYCAGQKLISTAAKNERTKKKGEAPPPHPTNHSQTMRLFSSLVTICALLFVSSASAKRREAATTPGTAKGAKEGDDVASAHQQQKVLSTGDAGAFAPPAVFRNKEVVRSINLEKSYVRVNTRVTVKNIDHKKSPHGDYYVPFAAGELKRDVGGIEVREENAGDSGKLDFSVVSDKEYVARLMLLALMVISF